MSTRWSEAEQAWIHFYHHLALSALQQNPSILAWVNGTTLQRTFNQYFSNAPERTADELIGMRNALVPGAMLTLRSLQSQVITCDDRLEIINFDITADMLTDYRSIAGNANSTFPDIPSEGFVGVWEFLNDTVEEQQLTQRVPIPMIPSSPITISDDEQSDSSDATSESSHADDVPTGPVINSSFNLKPHHDNETLTMNGSGTITATFRFKVLDEDFVQSDDIPLKKQGSADVTKESYVLPVPKAYTVPKSESKKPWKKVAGDGLTWKSGNQTWVAKSFFRVFRADNHAYTKSRYLENAFSYRVDPNSEAWVERYNKAVLQLARDWDATYQKKPRIPWTHRERRAMYRSLNEWCGEHGLLKVNPSSQALVQYVVR